MQPARFREGDGYLVRAGGREGKGHPGWLFYIYIHPRAAERWGIGVCPVVFSSVEFLLPGLSRAEKEGGGVSFLRASLSLVNSGVLLLWVVLGGFPCSMRDYTETVHSVQSLVLVFLVFCWALVRDHDKLLFGEQNLTLYTSSSSSSRTSVLNSQEFMSDLDSQTPSSFDPFADANAGGDSGAGSKEYVHVRVQQRNGRKCLTTVQGLKKEFSYNKILKDLKKEFCCNGTVVQDPELGQVIQLQGDQRKNVSTFLVQAGIVKKEYIKIHGF
ncbi:hypothetical protein Taro_044123 [Colocasia esculenta]|uniref:Protein translation factor SUI1 homolog n=1 Tax=Colocasia esculenta TaxID=4460 RepID=A0A843WI97_COLES|nr:hypothetical protein [Colocasia esculenta]